MDAARGRKLRTTIRLWQPRYPGQVSRGPEALRPRLATGLPNTEFRTPQYRANAREHNVRAAAAAGTVRQSAGQGRPGAWTVPWSIHDPVAGYGITLFTDVEKSLSTPALLYALTAKYHLVGARSSIATLVSAGPGSCSDSVYWSGAVP